MNIAFYKLSMGSGGSVVTTHSVGHRDYTFNTSLASMHSYLGEVEDTHKLAFLDGGFLLHVPLFYLEGVESTLPLRIQPNFITIVDRALRKVEAPYTIGVACVYRDGEWENKVCNHWDNN